MYAFVSPDKPDTTTIVANWIPFEEPAGGPNFFTFAEDAQYDIHIDNDGDAQGDLIFRYTFKTHVKNDKTFLYNTGVVESLDDPDLNITQTYDIELIKLKNQQVGLTTKLADDVPVAPSNVGKASMPDYEKLRDQAVYKLAERLDDVRRPGRRPVLPRPARLRPAVRRGPLRGRQRHAQGLQRQLDRPAGADRDDPPVREPADRRHLVDDPAQERQRPLPQVSRLGMPLVNEVVNPIKDKDKFNASSPADDGQFLKNVTEPELPKLIEAIYKIKAPAEPRNDLVDVFLKGVEGLNQPPHVTPVGAAAPQHLHRADRQAQAAGCAGRRQRGLPERAPAHATT